LGARGVGAVRSIAGSVLRAVGALAVVLALTVGGASPASASPPPTVAPISQDCEGSLDDVTGEIVLECSTGLEESVWEDAFGSLAVLISLGAFVLGFHLAREVTR
jgi:hypothetical protein